MSIEIALLAASVVFLVLSILVGYANYRTSVIGDRYIREQVLLGRYENIDSERELWDKKRTVQVTDPRIYNGSFWDWIMSLAWGSDYPGYTSFIVVFKYDEYPIGVIKDASEPLSDATRVY
jgi:hypothetical protein